MELLASLGAAAEPIAVPGGSKGASAAPEAGAAKRSGAAASASAQGGTTCRDGAVKEDTSGMLEAEAAAVAMLAAGAAGPTRKRGERPSNEFLLQRAVDSDVRAAEANAVAALSQNGRESARKRARQLDFGKNSPNSPAVFAQAYPIKGRNDDDGDDDEQPLSPASAAGTLLGFVGAAAQAQWYGDAGGPSTPNKRKACNCKNSKCLKLYCECFASGSYCSVSCNCQGCQNNEHYQSQRKSAIDATLERNPMAFRPKIAASALPAVEQSPSAHGRHTKGCHCKKSGCLKKYCECFQAGVLCSVQCKCHECKNTEESVERKALLTSSGWEALTPHDNNSRDRLATPSPEFAKRSRHLQSPHSARGLVLRKGLLGQGGGLSSILEPASTDGLLFSKMMGGSAGMGPAIALQIQETMMNMRVAHKDSSAACHMSSSVVGLPQERQVKLAERTVVRNHLSDPMLFNLCRVLMLSAKKVADSSGDGERLPPGAATSNRTLATPALAAAPDSSAGIQVKGSSKDSLNGDGAMHKANGKQVQDEESAVESKDVQMQRAVLLELRHYLGQMQAIMQARPASGTVATTAGASSCDSAPNIAQKADASKAVALSDSAP